MNWKQMSAVFSLLGVLALGLLLMSLRGGTPRTGHVHLSTVFEGFKGKIELEKRLQEGSLGNQKYLDSLSLSIKQMNEALLQNPGNQDLQRELEEKRERLQKDQIKIQQYTANQSQQLTEQIWAQINQYIEDFGREGDYEYIFGTDGTGTLMYGNTKKDLTGTILHYINQKYEGH